MAEILSGKAFARLVRKSIATRVEELSGPPPGLTVIMVGDDPASSVYVRSKERACSKVGFSSNVIHLPSDTSQEHVLGLIDDLNKNPLVHGILVQLPVPDHISPTAIASAVIPEKDVDGFHPVNVGRLWRGEDGLFPCTPSGIVKLLHHHEIKLKGMNAVIIGRSNIVGKPMASLLLRENCTVTIAHSKTRDLKAICQGADLLVAAVGMPRMINSDWVKKGVVAVDVGMNRDTDGNLCGDMDYDDVFPVASAITPVPGGVGPLTIAYLLQNTLKARESLQSI